MMVQCYPVNHILSSRRMPGSSRLLKFLDPGMRRDDGYLFDG